MKGFKIMKTIKQLIYGLNNMKITMNVLMEHLLMDLKITKYHLMNIKLLRIVIALLMSIKMTYI